jgi:sulfatase maturation enzyme AslB (radical SAM superfamily)
MILSEATWLQVENSTKCNAWCPACGRNQNGYGLNPALVVEDLSTERFEEVLKKLPNLETIQFSGTYGDTMAAANVLEHIALAIKYAGKIQIHTHGGIRSTQWWTELAELLKGTNHDVWFALDGLKGVHEIYRQGTDFDKTLANAQAFISAGGYATWQFIPWAHNEHQIKDCMRLSQKTGFKKFKFVTSVRENINARHWQTGHVIEFKPWSRSNITNTYHLNPTRDSLKLSDCRHLTNKSVYLNANGMVSPCCYLNIHRTAEADQLPDIEGEINSQHHPLCLTNCGNGVKLVHQ